MDSLSAVLRELRMESAAYRTIRVCAPFRVAFDEPALRGVHILLRGRAEFRLGGKLVAELGPGDLLITCRADPHELCSIGGSRAPIRMSSRLPEQFPEIEIVLPGSGEETAFVCGAFIAHESGHPALSGLPRYIHVPGESGRPAKWLAAYVDALVEEAFEQGPGSELVMARLSDALVVRALRHSLQAVDPGWLKGLRDPYLSKVLGALHDDLRRPWTLASLAELAGLSRAAFAARFTEVLGEPPMRYLMSCRMRHAMTLLRDERATLAHVAERVGYGSEAALSAAFKRHTGTAPGAYAREARRAT